MNIKKINLLVGAAYCAVALINLGLQAQTLPITAGLQLWLNADVGVTTNASAQVTAWADQSGLGNNATQPTVTSSPIYTPNSLNGHATLRVTGTQYMEVQNANGIDDLLNDVTVLGVVKYDNLSGYRGFVSKCTGGAPSPFDFWSNASANAGRTTFYLGNGTVNAATLSTIAPLTGVYMVMGFRWKDGVSDQFLNDFNIGSAGNTIATGNGATNLRIGRRQDGTVQLIGNLAEVLIYKPALSDADTYNVINNYFKLKYALPFNSPPSVSITLPANNTTVSTGTAIPVSINTSDSDGYAASVRVYGNGVLLATGSAVNTNGSGTFQLTVAGAYPGVMTLTAVATDNAGRLATSAPVLVNITGSTPTSPVLTGLRVWLKADAGVTTNLSGGITTWTDQSGNGNDAVQTTDTFAPLFVPNAVNGKPVLRFNGIAPSEQYLEVSDAGTAFLTNDFSTFALARFVGSYPALRQHVWSKCSTAGWASPVDWWYNTPNGEPFGYRGDGVNFAGVGGGTIGPTLGQYSVLGMEVTGVDGVMSHFLGISGNGTSVALTNTANAGYPLRIGRRADGGTQINGDIGEILIYDQALSGADRTNVTAYLMGKYGVVQPYNATPPPAINITSPANGASMPAPSTVTFAATASSANGSITRVTLSANGAVFATLTNAPYQVRLDLLTPGTVTFTAVALDNWGAQTISTNVVVTVTGSASVPPVTAGLKLQLAADLGVTTDGTGAVTSWIDQSGTGNNAAPTSATTSPLLVTNVINGKPVLRFSGADQSLEVLTDNTGFTAGDLSTFALVKFSNFSTFRTVWTKTQNNLAAPIDWYFAASSGAANLFRGNGTAYGNFTGTAPAAGAFVTVGAKISGTAISHYIGYNNTANGTITATPADTGWPLRIGRRLDGATQMMGDIAEILIYDHAVSDAERLQIVNYLNNKWGIGVVQLANVPPTAKILTPTNGTPISAPSTISIVASVSDPDSPISQVDFLVNGMLVASRTAAPYQIPLQVLSPGTLTFQVRATDFWGAVSNSAPVVVTVTGSGPASPPTAGRALWLKADAGVTTNSDGTVATWADQSGKGNNAAQDTALGYPSPLLLSDASGRPMLNFDGTIRYLVVPDAISLQLTNDMSLFCAASCDDFSAVNMICNKGFLAHPHPFNFYVDTAGQTLVSRGDDRGTSTVTSTSALPVATNVVVGFTVLGSTGTEYLQGLPNGTGPFGYGDIDDATQLYIGTRDALDLYFKGNIGELLIYDRALAGSDLQLVNSYLAGRYGVATAQLSTQPPTLNVALAGTNAVRVSWLPGYAGFILEGRTNLTLGAWSSIATDPPNNQVTLGTTNVARFFRLRSQ
jgi:Bacterial Ig domain/Concanavalin A-like lectin/glucanases superfamily